MADSHNQITVSMIMDIANGTEGAQEATSALTDLIYPKVYGILVSRDPSSIDDITQNTFIRIIEFARKTPDRLLELSPENLPSYIQRIAQNAAIDHLRILTSRSEDVTDDLPDAPDSSPPADVYAEARMFEKAIARLSPERQTILRMKFYDGASDEDIANKTNTPVGTVKSSAARSVVFLREYADRNRRSGKGE